MFNLFGPQQYLYEDAIKFGHGLGCEAAWMLMHPLFEQANERNYHTEAMVRIVWFQKISIPPRRLFDLHPHHPPGLSVPGGLWWPRSPFPFPEFLNRNFAYQPWKFKVVLVLENKESEY